MGCKIVVDLCYTAAYIVPMSKKTDMPIRAIRIEDATWLKLVKLSAPENASILVRKVLRDYVSKTGGKK